MTQQDPQNDDARKPPSTGELAWWDQTSIEAKRDVDRILGRLQRRLGQRHTSASILGALETANRELDAIDDSTNNNKKTRGVTKAARLEAEALTDHRRRTAAETLLREATGVAQRHIRKAEDRRQCLDAIEAACNEYNAATDEAKDMKAQLSLTKEQMVHQLNRAVLARIEREAITWAEQQESNRTRGVTTIEHDDMVREQLAEDAADRVESWYRHPHEREQVVETVKAHQINRRYRWRQQTITNAMGLGQ